MCFGPQRVRLRYYTISESLEVDITFVVLDLGIDQCVETYENSVVRQRQLRSGGWRTNTRDRQKIPISHYPLEGTWILTGVPPQTLCVGYERS